VYVGGYGVVWYLMLCAQVKDDRYVNKFGRRLQFYSCSLG